jgi:hypothetical protein
MSYAIVAAAFLIESVKSRDEYAAWKELARRN